MRERRESWTHEKPPVPQLGPGSPKQHLVLNINSVKQHVSGRKSMANICWLGEEFIPSGESEIRQAHGVCGHSYLRWWELPLSRSFYFTSIVLVVLEIQGTNKLGKSSFTSTGLLHRRVNYEGLGIRNYMDLISQPTGSTFSFFSNSCIKLWNRTSVWKRA